MGSLLLLYAELMCLNKLVTKLWGHQTPQLCRDRLTDLKVPPHPRSGNSAIRAAEHDHDSGAGRATVDSGLRVDGTIAEGGPYKPLNFGVTGAICSETLGRTEEYSEANGRVVHRKSFANTYSTNIVEGAGHSWNPGLFVDVSWNGGPVGKLTATKSQKPSYNFVEGIFDALTSYR